MKPLTSESPRKITTKRISKPQMEKRRRERINHSLETLRLLLLENTDDENMKNPKVGKAEILEGVIHFLKAEKGHQGAMAREKNQPSDGQHSYQDGMRSCLLRVRSFISSQNQELMESVASGPGAQEPQDPPLYPGKRHLAPVLIPPADPSPGLLHLHHQHHQHQPFLTQLTGMSCETQELFSTMAAPHHASSAVWRPWPK